MSGRTRQNHQGAMVDLFALGPLELWHEGVQIPLGPVQRRVLAVLLHARGEPVSVDRLTERVWEDGEPPANSLETMRTYMSKIRRRLEAAGNEARLEPLPPRQYRLRVRPDGVDLLRFQHLLARARAAAGRGEAGTAIGLLREAEALWRGEPLTEFTGEWAASARIRLSEDLLRVKQERIGLELELGRHADLVGELGELVAENPFAQRIVGLRMLALYRSGRHTESLEVYRDTYRRLTERGMRPDAGLQKLNQRIIGQDPGLELDRDLAPKAVRAAPEPAGHAEPSEAPAAARPPAPGHDGGGATEEIGTHGVSSRGGDHALRPSGNLPRDTRDFTGRTGELAALLAEPVRPDGGDETATPVTVLYGMPGIGKTATAVRAARRMKDRYPDGAYYVDLRGYSDQSRCEPREALALLLRTSGAAVELPDSLDERAARWREWTARHRALVVLDNAHATRQVTPLLPGAPGCRAIVTSRVRLAGLDGAQPLFLDALSANEAMELFSRVAGAARTSDRAALRRIVDACGRHPLALQLLAGRFRHRESWDLEHLHDRLAQADDPLEEFDAGLSQSIQLSYAELGDGAQRLLRHLALQFGPDITLGGASALLGTDVPTARQGVEALHDAHLLSEAARGRYELHDLVRAFALQICRRDEPESTRHAATDRLLTYYVRSADHADRLVHPLRRRLSVSDAERAEDPVHAEEFADADEASVWLDIERASLLAAADHVTADAPACAASFAHVLVTSMKSWGAWDLAARLQATAVGVLREGTDLLGLAQALTERADILAREAPGEALSWATEALSIFEEMDDVEGCADALLQTGRARLAAGEGMLCRNALARALPRYRQAGNRHGEAETLNVRGVALQSAGKRREAEVCFRSMHRIYEQLGDERGMLRSLNNLGEMHRLAGRHDKARAHYEECLALLQRVGGRQERANLYNNLGIVCQATGETRQALDYFRQALSSYRNSHDALGESDTLTSLGAAYAASERYNEALWHYMRAEQIACRIDNPDLQKSALIGIAAVQRRLHRYDLAEENGLKALDLAREADIPMGTAEALEGLAHVAAMTKGAGAARALADEAAQLYESIGEKQRAASLRTGVVSRGVTGS